LAYARPATEGEVTEAVAYLTAQRAHFESQPSTTQPPTTPPAVQALATLCQVLLCSNQFLYVD
jgi:hypothetical protein